MTGRVWRRVGQVAGLAAMAGLGLFDVLYGDLRTLPWPTGGARSWLLVGQVALAVAATLVWLPARRPGTARLVLAGVVVGASLLLSLGRILPLHTDALAGWLPYPDGYGLWPVAESAGLLGVVYVLARWPRPVPAVIGTAAAGLAVVVLPYRSGSAGAQALFAMIYLVFVALAAAGGIYLRMLETARDRRIAEVRAEQQAEFARDLHDFVAHHVTGIVVQAQGARYIAADDPERAMAALAEIERAGTEAMTVMRRMVGVLRGSADPAPLAPLGGLADLPELVDAFSTAGPTAARLHTTGELDGLPVEVTSSAYRVVMEALTNVRQHAGDARQVEVSVTRTPAWLVVRVTDDGPGGRSGGRSERTGFGLLGLSERVSSLGGRLEAGPGPAGGWVVDATLPVTGAQPR